jgi:hypothetical protein
MQFYRGLLESGRKVGGKRDIDGRRFVADVYEEVLR